MLYKNELIHKIAKKRLKVVANISFILNLPEIIDLEKSNLL